MDAASYLFLVFGTVIYQKFFSSWSYRTIFAFSQVLLVVINLLDLLWVTRTNVKMGIPDKLFLFGEDLLGPIVRRLSEMPMLILAAKICPSGVEATLFALIMGLSNFGATIGQYLGAALLQMLGGVEAPDFQNLWLYVLIRSLCRFAPIFLIKFMVPKGSPNDDAMLLADMEPEVPTQSEQLQSSSKRPLVLTSSNGELSKQELELDEISGEDSRNLLKKWNSSERDEKKRAITRE